MASSLLMTSKSTFGVSLGQLQKVVLVLGIINPGTRLDAVYYLDIAYLIHSEISTFRTIKDSSLSIT